ncbi:MAG: galactokinase family protein [Planctomycetota bacterium]
MPPLVELLERAARRLQETGHQGREQVHALYVPGRIEVLGKHTDYGGGRSLVAVTERGMCLVAAPRADARVRLIDVVLEDAAEFTISADLKPVAGHWVNYPMTVARRIARNFGTPLRGADIAFGSNLPAAAGLSSSSALIVGIFLALARLNELKVRPEYREHLATLEDLSGYLGSIENGRDFGELRGDLGVGTLGGSEDHTAILCALPGVLLQYAYLPVRFEQALPLPADHVFAVGFSGVSAEKTGAAREPYNRASQLMASVVDLWQRHSGCHDPHMGAALAQGNHAAELARSLLALHDHPAASRAELLARFEHFAAENEEILPGAARALGAGELERFGELVDRSQLLAERLLKNQVPETSFLARAARDEGAAAASAFGAGFGGSVWALIRRREGASFLEAWAARYGQEFPQRSPRARFFLSGAGPAAFSLGGGVADTSP